MSKRLSITLLSFLFCLTLAAKTDSILFIGNSYTSTNNIPTLFKNLATKNELIKKRDPDLDSLRHALLRGGLIGDFRRRLN